MCVCVYESCSWSTSVPRTRLRCINSANSAFIVCRRPSTSTGLLLIVNQPSQGMNNYLINGSVSALALTIAHYQGKMNHIILELPQAYTFQQHNIAEKKNNQRYFHVNYDFFFLGWVWRRVFTHYHQSELEWYNNSLIIVLVIYLRQNAKHISNF